MDSSITSILMSALGGGAGGNILGMLMKNRSMGPMWNTILGAIGGILGGQALGTTMSGIGGDIGGGAIGGILLTLIGSFLKKKKPAT
jgi:hypothetical protein